MGARTPAVFFNDTATTEIYTLSLHDALPIFDLELRLLELHTAVTALLREHRPDVVAIERVFTQNNKGTATGTAQAAGVAALAAAQADRPVAWHTPSEVKAAISGNGRADKEQEIGRASW